MSDPLTIEEVFTAYYECRKTKRYSKSALSFEINLEERLVELFYELKNYTWQPGRYNAFIVTKPVRREIFAAPFKDRIVHHILINRLNQTFEKYFIFDSYACRKGKGTHAAIKRVEHFVKSESHNVQRQAWVLKLDIKGFFMNVDRNLLWQKLSCFIDKYYDSSADFEKYLARTIIFNDPSKNCVLRSPKEEWLPLPRDKSLFTTKENCGLPIGNLTSQVFANFFLTELDHFVKHRLGIKKYVRYVDDCVFVSADKSLLKSVIKKVRSFLKNQLNLTLHPKKIYLQPVYSGVEFLGTFIRPDFTQSSRRVKNNFVQALKKASEDVKKEKPCPEKIKEIFASINSYLGILGHYKNYKFTRRQIQRNFSDNLKKHFKVPEKLNKICFKY